MIYTGLRKSAQHIARVAVDEDVDAVGLSILSGSHLELVEQVIGRLREADAADIKVFVGGTIPAVDHEHLERLGVRGIFTSNMPLAAVVESLSRELA